MTDVTTVFAERQIPAGYCQCGCGQKTPFYTYSDPQHGVVKGQPCRYVHGHNGRHTPVARFWSKVDKKGPDDCWKWTGTKYKGYGRFTIHGKEFRAHRVAYELVNGPVSDGLEICHRCDVPACCNPAHLFVGTHKDNMLDAISKNRFVNGEQDGNSKLTHEQVIKIRTLYWQGGYAQRELGRQYGVSGNAISQIVHGATWRHVPGPVSAPPGWRQTRRASGAT